MAFLEIIKTIIGISLIAVISEGVRRLYFHSLSHIPGPKLTALTWWYEFYFDAIQQGQYVFKIQKLHKIYGPIIRVTPDELHIEDVGFLDAIYAPSMSRRDKYEYQLRTLRVPGGVGTTARHDVHKKRREALNPFFSKRNVLDLEPIIAEKVDQLCTMIGKHSKEKVPINLSDLFFAFSNDVVINFLFAHQVDLLSDEKTAAISRQNSKELLMGVNMNKHFPWIPDFLEWLPESISRPIMPPGLIDMLALFDRVRAELIDIMKVKASGKVDQNSKEPKAKESVYASVVDNPSLPPQERTLLRLEQEGALLAIAGTESPAQTLNILFYHLLSNPSILATLRAEINSVPLSWSNLDKLPYLSAVIEEANRLSFGVTARAARIAHEPLVYTPTSYTTSPHNGKSYTIPSGTPVSITTLCAHTAETVFPSPYVFDPTRWLGDEGRERRKFQLAFSKGGRKCLGIELANAELCLVTAALVQKFEMELWETDEDDVAFLHDYHVAMPKMGSKGVRVTAKLL